MLRSGLLLLLVVSCSGKLAHVLQNRTQLFPKNHTSRHRRLTRAEQTVAANEWWCARPERHGSLRCRRHQLQRKHQQATDATVRDAAAHELRDLLESAPTLALASMQEETETMLRGWCALATSAGLDLCIVASGGKVSRSRHNTGRHRKSSSKGAESGSSSSKVLAERRKKKKKRGIAVLWSAEALALLRAWWCADRRHMREPRCSRGVRWTRQQPGLSAMRRLFCAQQDMDGSLRNSTGTGDAVGRLCLGRAAVIAAAVHGAAAAAQGGGSGAFQLSSGGRAGVGGGGMRQRRVLRASTVVKLMLVLLACALVTGWKMRHLITGKRQRQQSDHSSTQTAEGWEGCRYSEGIVGGDSAARRRHTPKRARV